MDDPYQKWIICHHIVHTSRYLQPTKKIKERKKGDRKARVIFTNILQAAFAQTVLRQ
jgi:hypothetical protein